MKRTDSLEKDTEHQTSGMVRKSYFKNNTALMLDSSSGNESQETTENVGADDALKK